MDEALVLIAAYQTWIYAALGLVAVVYLRIAIRHHQEASAAQFGLERERAEALRNRALGMLALIAAAALSTFVLSITLSPQVPTTPPTPIPTISLLAPVPGEPVESTGDPAAGCLNPLATITEPVAGQEIRGVIELTGTANIASFAFYKIEIKASEPGAPWQVVTAGTEPVQDDLLAVWDTSLVQNGVYLLQLVVTDTEGNAPLPCTLEVTLLPPGS